MSILIRIFVKHRARKMARFFFAGFLLGLTCLNVSGQSINELRKLWQNNNFAILSGSQKEKLYTSTDFYKYSEIRDDEFASYLKETWTDYSIIAGIANEPSHPAEQLVFDEADLDMNPPVNLAFSNIIGDKEHENGKIKLIPRIRKPESDTFNAQKIVFRFYGQQISINFDKLLVLSKISFLSEDSISGFWTSFARSNSNQLVDQLMDYRDLLGMGDWGYFQLVKATSNHIFAGNVLNADLLTWALMIRSGFDVRLAFNQNSTTVLFPSENTIYSKQFVVIGQTRFYLDREMRSQLLVTCQNPFPDNVDRIDLNFYKSLNFSRKPTIRMISFRWDNKNFEFSMHSNPEAIRFYKDYPQTDASVYFGAPVSSVLKENLLRQFYPILSKMDRLESAAFLQQFVQKEFTYVRKNQKDDFSNNRFAEEVIASKSGDDTSKAVLYSWLVRILLHLPVVGVQFPDYYSTAVCYDTPVDGNYYYLNRDKYYITDPTYLNAPIGVTMPAFEGLTPQLIDLSSSFSQQNDASNIWELARKLGALRGGTSQDVVFDRQGRALITGYFSDRSSSCFPFVACFSRGNSLQWIRKFEGNGKALPFAITKASDDEIYIAGSFTGKIFMDEKELQSEPNKSDLFLAQFNQNGDLVWMNKIGMDSAAENESLTYLVKFDRSGENITTQWSNEDERNIRNGFSKPDESGLSFTGSKSFTAGIVPLSWTSTKSDISKDIYNEYSFLIKNKCHPKVAGVIAVMKLLQKTGAEVTGKQLQALITQYNPTFPAKNASLFHAIGQVGLLKNENGIVTLNTIGCKPILYANLKLEDEARFNVSGFDNMDLSVNMIEGFRKAVKEVSLTLNSLLIDSSSGNLVLDYDHDHTLKTVSLEIIFPK
ncbi:MAG: hypothetical protein GZ094_11180 [Mariniphaga sp.]|nr:hypothetical protein [Mariniphaga sp.]